MTDWAEWGTTTGTLVLAGATFAAIRSSNRSTRIAERSLLAGMRPLLVSARRDDPPQEIQFADGHVFANPPGEAPLVEEGDVIYLAMALRNAGTGIAHIHGYRLEPESADRVQADPRARPGTVVAAQPPIRSPSPTSNATSTSLPATPASGKPPCATTAAAPTATLGKLTTATVGSPSTFSTATSKTGNRPSAASFCSPQRATPARGGAT